MKETVKLVITDLDGTLITSEKSLPGDTMEVITRIREQGILFGIATGRSLRALTALLPKWNLEDKVDVLVGTNGAEYWDKDGYIWEGKFLLDEDMRDIYEKTKGEEVSCGVFDDRQCAMVVDHVNEAVKRKKCSPGKNISFLSIMSSMRAYIPADGCLNI